MTELCQIWLSDTMYCVVDPIDFEWAKRWKWHATANSTGKKFYATRMTTVPGVKPRKQVKVYLHKEILKRTPGKYKPNADCSIGDHDDGDSLNCRRDNLFWATLRTNNTAHRYKHVLQYVALKYDADSEFL